MKVKRLLVLVAVLSVSGVLWFSRYQISVGPYYAEYDIWVTDTLSPQHDGGFGGELEFGLHRFMAGSFQGNALNIGVRSVIPDSAIQEFDYPPNYSEDPQYYEVDSIGWKKYIGPPVEDPPDRFIKIPVRSRLPKRFMNQRYLFHFTLYPRDSVHLEIIVHDKSDCSPLPKFAKTAYLRQGPCSY
jgi:hypothetical protein